MHFCANAHHWLLYTLLLSVFVQYVQAKFLRNWGSYLG
nr:MAG TPA: hypothetical protein [Caudoviricetes sp.]